LRKEHEKEVYNFNTMPRPQHQQQKRQSASLPADFDSKLVDLSRVTRVRAGGRRFSFRAVVIIGNEKGKVGIGVAKGSDVTQAIEKANRQAMKTLLHVPIHEETIAYEVSAKYRASHVLLKPQQKGRGLVAGSVVRTMCEKAGIKNISAKLISKTHNKLNNAMATKKALAQLK
jgi:small subunit ribosomal protein S5